MTRSALEASGIKSRTKHISDRAKKIVISPIKEIAILAAEIPDVIPFAWGVPFVDTPVHIRKSVKDALDSDHLLGRYAPSAGLPELRHTLAERLSKRHTIKVSSKEILVTAGAMEGLMDAILTVVDAGDEVIMTSPGFSSYIDQVIIAGGKPKYLPLDESRNWALEIDMLPKLITKKTKAIIINSPCNPTGSIFTGKELAAIKETVKKHNLILITDEPYEFLLFNGAKLPTLVDDDELRYNRISCFSFSKEYAMTGYRVGYVFAEEGMIRQMMKAHDAFIVSAPRPSQIAALSALESSQKCVAELRKTLQDRRDRLCMHLDRMKKWFSYVKPRGTYYVFPKILFPCKDDVKLAIDILNKAHVAIVPGSAFGPQGKGHLRFCFGCTIPEIDEGMKRLYYYLSKGTSEKL